MVFCPLRARIVTKQASIAKLTCWRAGALWHPLLPRGVGSALDPGATGFAPCGRELISLLPNRKTRLERVRNSALPQRTTSCRCPCGPFHPPPTASTGAQKTRRTPVRNWVRCAHAFGAQDARWLFRGPCAAATACGCIAGRAKRSRECLPEGAPTRRRRVFRRHMDVPPKNPASRRGLCGQDVRKARKRGGLSFGSFSLAKQRK